MESFKVSMVRPGTKGALSEAELRCLDSSIAKVSLTVDSGSFKEFVGLVGKKGCVFCPSTFKGHRKSKETYEQSQLVALYFKGIGASGMKPVRYDKIRSRAERYNLPILFAYDCYSSDYPDGMERFCIVFLLSDTFLELYEAEAVQKALMMIFLKLIKSAVS